MRSSAWIAGRAGSGGPAQCVSTHATRGSGGTLVLHDDVILFTGTGGLTAFSAADGKQLWSSPMVQGPSGNHPPDLFVADGLVWGGDPPGGDHPGRTAVRREGREIHTGEVRRSIEVPKLLNPFHHFRCYRSKATDHFLLLPRCGVEFFDIQGSEHVRNDWVRGTCSYGFLPCNGLLYMPPHACFCFPAVQLDGFYALASRPSGGAAQADDTARLQRGPAFVRSVERGRETSGESLQTDRPLIRGVSGANDKAVGDGPPAALSPGDWSTYRHDAARSGHVAGDVPADLSPHWRTPLGGRLSQPVVAAGKLFVAQVDAHTVHALDAASGRAPGLSRPAAASIHRRPSMPGWSFSVVATAGCIACGPQTASWSGGSAAPAEQRIVAFDQLESPWPVPGSVLVQNGVAYLAVGRSSYLDGGVYLYGLDPVSGRVLYQTRVASPQPDPFKELAAPIDIQGTKSDILVGDGTNLYLYKMVFDAKLHLQETPRMTDEAVMRAIRDSSPWPPGPDQVKSVYSLWGDHPVGLHLMRTGGLVDYEWFDRTFWVYSRRWPGYYAASKAPKAGQILVFDDRAVYGLHVFTRTLFLSPAYEPGGGCTLFADDVNSEPALVLTPYVERLSFSRGRSPSGRIWSRSVRGGWSWPARRSFWPVRATLYRPTTLSPRSRAAWARSSGRFQPPTARSLPNTSSKSAPVFDGLMAAAGRLYLSTVDGAVVCLGRK